MSNLTIAAVATQAASNVLYPGGNGDVDPHDLQPEPYPVTITAVNLPTNTSYANGYTTSALTTHADRLHRLVTQRRHLEPLERDQRQLAQPHDRIDGGRERAAQQPSDGDAHERRQHDRGSAGGL